MIDFDNRTEFTFDITLFEEIVQSFTEKEIEFILTHNDEIQAINKEFREIDAPTDVLSFPYDEMPFAPLGSIMISFDYVRDAATAFGHSNEDELTLLFIHGLLHILGYDHEVDNGEMREKESELIQKYNMPKSLIVRTQG